MIEKNKLKRIIRNTGNKKRVLYTYSIDNPEIKRRHEAYISFLNANFIPSIFSHAYTKNRSIYTNAKAHLLNDKFIKIDVKNYFPSINHYYLASAIHFELNKYKKNTISLSECHSLIRNSSVHNIGLPLGLIPSPTLSNIYLKKFDSLFYSKLKELSLQNLIYTRYADDIFVSFKADKDNSPLPEQYYKEIIDLCKKELRRCHLDINEKKTKFINLNISNHVKLAGINLVKSENGARRLTISRKTIKDLYFRSISIHDKVKKAGVKSDVFTTEVNYIKGMQSFILSVEKTGYSHILSERMNENVTRLGYKNLEELIFKLGRKPTKD